MTRTTVRVDLSGPLFTRDPTKTIRANASRMLDGLAGEMERAVQTDIAGNAGSMPFYTGHTHDRIIGRTESLSGKDWMLHAVVSANTAGMSREDAIRTKAAAASIEERWHPFRRVKSAVSRSRAVLTANLTKGLE